MPKRDYSSFTSAAKSRFRPVAEELGFEQLTGIMYARNRGGWYDMFGLQAAQYGNDFFYVNYGISTPDLCPVAEPEDLRETGLLLGHRLPDVDGSGAFDRGNKNEIERSAANFLIQFRKEAEPWFMSFKSWNDIAKEYLATNPIARINIGCQCKEYGEDFRTATYGYLMLKAENTKEAMIWLREAERLMALPEYITRDGRVVYEKEKYARFQKPKDYEVEGLRYVRETISRIESAASNTPGLRRYKS